MQLIVEVIRVVSEQRESAEMDEKDQVLKRTPLIQQTLVLAAKRCDNPTLQHWDFGLDPLRITFHGDEFRLGDRFKLELTPVR